MTEGRFNLLHTLCTTPGPVGRETLVQRFIHDCLSEYCSEIEQDRIGNLIATLPGSGKHYTLVAHADEVGFLVSYIDDNGFLQAKWNTQGYQPDLRLLPGTWVELMTESGMVQGCFCVKTAHIAGSAGKRKIPRWEEVFIDIGVSNKAEVEELGIHVGTPVVYAPVVKQVGKNVMGKSFDDRVGLLMILELCKKLSTLSEKERPTVTFASTVMEEIGAKGVNAIAREFDVDGAVVLEVGLADDYPGTSNEAGVSLGAGPVIVIKDSQIVYSHEQNRIFFEVAEKNDIAIQRAVYHNYATDGFPIAAQGLPVSTIGIPCRYTHSSFETINLDDVNTAIDLVYKFLLN